MTVLLMLNAVDELHSDPQNCSSLPGECLGLVVVAVVDSNDAVNNNICPGAIHTFDLRTSCGSAGHVKSMNQAVVPLPAHTVVATRCMTRFTSSTVPCLEPSSLPSTALPLLRTLGIPESPSMLIIGTKGSSPNIGSDRCSAAFSNDCEEPKR